MSKFVNSIVLGLVVFVMMVSLFYYVEDVRADRQVSVEKVQPNWGTVDGQVSEIRTSLSFHNPHKTPVQLVRIIYEVHVDDHVLDNGTRYQTLRIPGESNGTVQFTARLSTDFVGDWWESFAAAGEGSELLVQGRTIFKVGPSEVEVPFGHGSPWRSSLLAAIADGLDNCPTEPSTVCLASAEPQWGTAPGEPPSLRLALVIQNPNASLVKMRDFKAAVLLEGVPVARVALPSAVELAPSSLTQLDLQLSLDPARFSAWWPRHVAQCERSATLVEIQFGIEEQPQDAADDNVTGPGPASYSAAHWKLPGQPFETRFLCAPQ